MRENDVQIAILTVPAEAAQVAADKAVDGGVKGILNFAPQRLAATPGVFIHQLDLSTELMVVCFYLSQRMSPALSGRKSVKDLRDFISAPPGRGELAVVDTPVDPVLEITEIADRVVKAGGPGAPLHATRRARPCPVLINQFGSHERMCLALRRGLVRRAGRAGASGLVDLEVPHGPPGRSSRPWAGSRTWPPCSRGWSRAAPARRWCCTGDEIDLDALPVLQCWPLDGGRFITLPLVFTRHPGHGRRNVGMYRLQVFDTRHHRHALAPAQGRGRALPGGAGPAWRWRWPSAPTRRSPTPPPRRCPGIVDEMLFAGFLRGEAVDMVQCRTVDLEVPAHAEFVLEGYVDLGETPPGRALRRPHRLLLAGRRVPGASTSPRSPTGATPSTPPPSWARPPMEDAYLGKATERLFLPLLRLTLPELVDMDLPKEGGFHNCALVSMRQALPAARAQGDARAVGHGADAVHQVHRGGGRGRGRARLRPGGLAGRSTTSTGSGT